MKLALWKNLLRAQPVSGWAPWSGSGLWQPFKKSLFQCLPVSKPPGLSFTSESWKGRAVTKKAQPDSEENLGGLETCFVT